MYLPRNNIFFKQYFEQVNKQGILTKHPIANVIITII
jgi:hypothetical protein